MNKFFDALNARIVADSAKLSTTNIKKLEKARDRMKSKKIVDMLEACSVDEAFAEINVYAIEKIAVYALNAIKLDKDFNVMSLHVFKTAMNAAKAETTMTLKDAADACSADRKVSDDRVHIVSQRREICSEDTVKAQHQSSVAALRALNVLTDAQSTSRETHFTVNVENVIYQKLAKQLSA